MLQKVGYEQIHGTVPVQLKDLCLKIIGFV